MDPPVPKSSLDEDQSAVISKIEEEIERDLVLTHNQEKSHEFVKKLYEFASKENEFCEIASAGGIAFKSKDKLKKFKESFQNDDKTSLALGTTTYKGFKDNLSIYNFSKVKGLPYYSNPHFTKVKPKLKIMAVSKIDRRLLNKSNRYPTLTHQEALDAQLSASDQEASEEQPSASDEQPSASDELPSNQQKIRKLEHDCHVLADQMDKLQEKIDNATIELEELLELENNLPPSEMTDSCSTAATGNDLINEWP
ncbi:hypothetical protein MKX03_014620, partial [Papaver bracteatum]